MVDGLDGTERGYQGRGALQLPQAKDKGNEIMVEPEKPLKKKDQIAFDEEVGRKLEAQMKAKMEKEERIARKKDEANIALIPLALMDADHELAERLQAEEQGELTIEESFEELQKAFDNTMSWINSFVPMEKDRAEGSETRAERSSKREGEELESDKSKKQKLDEKISSYHLIRADGSSKRYSSMIQMLQHIDRKDMETLCTLVKANYGNTRPEEGYERVLWGDLKVMFEPDIESEVWRKLQGNKVKIWKLFSSCGVHFVRSKMGEVDINTLMMDKYLALARGHQASGVVKPGIGGNSCKEMGGKTTSRNNQHLGFAQAGFHLKEEIKEVKEIKEAVAHREPTPREVTLDELPIVNHYVAPYEPSNLFPRRLEQHAEEALVHKTMESLKSIKEQVLASCPFQCYLGSFILLCSIGKLTFSNDLGDLRASVSIMPLLMFKSLVDFAILDIVEDFRMPIILGRPLLATAHAEVDVLRKLISLEVGNEKESQDEIDYRCSMLDQGEPWEIEIVEEPNKIRDIDLSPFMKQKVCVMTKERILKDYWRREPNPEETIDVNPNFNPTQEENSNIEEDYEDLENFGKKKLELILDKKSYDDFVDINDVAYKERMCNLLGMTYKKPSLVLIEKVEVTRYMIGPRESYTKVRILGIKEMPTTSANIVAVRAELMEEMDAKGSVQRETFIQHEDGSS
uniref:Reverse transcriptase domain-containing protein n=1 Tax=Tanacetum cinerariifolium TaxID=118510 RepID=A0A6L2K8U9_TANCI|nr:hypothetical protein [Tanacetum cinerariifolium]